MKIPASSSMTTQIAIVRTLLSNKEILSSAVDSSRTLGGGGIIPFKQNY